MPKTKNGALATKATAKKKPGGNSNNNSGKDDRKEYEALQNGIQHAIKLIDAALEGYYHNNPHFPRSKQTKFFEWTIDRAGGSPVVKVFFRENCLPREIANLKEVEALMGKKLSKAAVAAMMTSSNGNGAAHALMATAAGTGTGSSNLPSVYTYDEVGAPPSGPQDPGRPKTP